MRTPIEVLEDYLKDIKACEDIAMANNNNKDMRKIKRYKEQFQCSLKAIEQCLNLDPIK